MLLVGASRHGTPCDSALQGRLDIDCIQSTGGTMSKYPHARRASKLATATPRMTVLGLSLLLALPPIAQEAPPTAQEAVELDTVQVLGSRAKGRTAAETAAPVDVINREL